MSAGDTIHIPGGSTGGGGQECIEPYLEARHMLHMRIVSESTHADHRLTANEAFKARVQRLKESGVVYEVDGLTVTYTGHNGDMVTLEYRSAT